MAMVMKARITERMTIMVASTTTVTITRTMRMAAMGAMMMAMIMVLTLSPTMTTWPMMEDLVEVVAVTTTTNMVEAVAGPLSHLLYLPPIFRLHFQQNRPLFHLNYLH